MDIGLPATGVPGVIAADLEAVVILPFCHTLRALIVARELFGNVIVMLQTPKKPGRPRKYATKAEKARRDLDPPSSGRSEGGIVHWENLVIGPASVFRPGAVLATHRTSHNDSRNNICTKREREILLM